MLSLCEAITRWTHWNDGFVLLRRLPLISDISEIKASAGLPLTIRLDDESHVRELTKVYKGFRDSLSDVYSHESTDLVVSGK